MPKKGVTINDRTTLALRIIKSVTGDKMVDFGNIMRDFAQQPPTEQPSHGGNTGGVPVRLGTGGGQLRQSISVTGVDGGAVIRTSTNYGGYVHEPGKPGGRRANWPGDPFFERAAEDALPIFEHSGPWA